VKKNVKGWNMKKKFLKKKQARVNLVNSG
jgi:hypothetical protein